MHVKYFLYSHSIGKDDTLNVLNLELTLFHLKHMDLIKQLPIIMDFLRKSDFHTDIKVTICLLFW
jgi:hypothetical protein